MASGGANGVRKKKSTFMGLDGFPNIVQDDMGMLRALYVGSLVADRNQHHVGRPGMNVGDAQRIDDLAERDVYEKIINKLKNTMRTPRTQTKNTKEFISAIGFDSSPRNFDPNRITEENLADLQERLKDRYRIVLVKYHSASGLCSLAWQGEPVLPRVIFLATDGLHWDVLNSTNGVFGTFLCSACLKTSDTSTTHRCKYTCYSCSSLLINGNCDGDLKIRCDDCGFIFKTQKCFDAHKHVRTAVNGTSRCDVLKFCLGCGSVYRPSNGVHVCGQAIYCGMCRDYTSDQHKCTWPEFTQKQRENLQSKQKKFLFAFYDIETTQATDFEEGQDPDYYDEHFCTTIAVIKVCYHCEKSPVDEPCPNCGTRKVIFQYESKDEDPFKVVDNFCDFLMTDKTMKKRTLYSHNGGRFDTHLVLKGFLRKGIKPKIINKGSTIIRAEFTLRGFTVILKDSYTAIPIPLADFTDAFDLPCKDKGTFPHLANTRSNWGRVWDSIPPKRYFSDEFMKPGQKKLFDEWHASMIGKRWDQDEELKKYCYLDVEICMLGCLKYRQTMLDQTGWCPFTTANTLAAFCQFQLKAEFLNGLEMPYLPEAGYGALNQSMIALKYIKWMEKQHNRTFQHAHSPLGEKKIRIGNQHFSLDCYDQVEDKVTEIMGCYFHGCPTCYMPGTKLVGEERSEELFERTAMRIRHLRTLFKQVDVVWECDINKQLSAFSDMKTFFDTTEIIERLKLRDALYGGRVEVLRTYLESTTDKVVKYYDICSMYPSVMALREYPLGFPEVITSNFKPVDTDVFPYRGIAKVRVVAPQNLKIAVLPQRAHGSLIFGLCGPCVSDRSEVCTHTSDEERSWIGTYATVELNLALQRGYKVTKVYEVWHWNEWSDQVYKGYFKKFMRMKFAASKYPAGVKTQADREEYCRKINEKLDFGLTPDQMEPSPARRTVSKFMNNSCWGKLAEVPCHRKVEYLTVKEYLALRSDASRVVKNVVFESNSMVRVTHSPKIETIRANKFSAVHHAIFVTAYARVLIYTIIEKVGSGAGYMDTDSIVFEMDRNGEDPLGHLLTGALGELTDEVKDGWQIDEAVFGGCKNYSMVLRNLSTDEVVTKLASKGFTKDVSTLEALKHTAVKEITLTKEPAYIAIKRPELKRKMGEVTTQVCTKKYRPTSTKSNTLGVGADEYKRPYGFRE